jgi:hypothetical protein
MKHQALAAVLSSVVLCAPIAAFAKGGGHSIDHSSGHSGYASGHSSQSASHGSSTGSAESSPNSASYWHGYGGRASPWVNRNAHGKIARDPHAKEAFRKNHPCPATGKTYGACPGWVVDHRQALKHGGADDPSNMQWQTHAEAKAKDRWE